MKQCQKHIYWNAPATSQFSDWIWQSLVLFWIPWTHETFSTCTKCWCAMFQSKPHVRNNSSTIRLQEQRGRGENKKPPPYRIQEQALGIGRRENLLVTYLSYRILSTSKWGGSKHLASKLMQPRFYCVYIRIFCSNWIVLRAEKGSLFLHQIPTVDWIRFPECDTYFDLAC